MCDGTSYLYSFRVSLALLYLFFPSRTRDRAFRFPSRPSGGVSLPCQLTCSSRGTLTHATLTRQAQDSSLDCLVSGRKVHTKQYVQWAPESSHLRSRGSAAGCGSCVLRGASVAHSSPRVSQSIPERREPGASQARARREPGASQARARREPGASQARARCEPGAKKAAASPPIVQRSSPPVRGGE